MMDLILKDEVSHHQELSDQWNRRGEYLNSISKECLQMGLEVDI